MEKLIHEDPMTGELSCNARDFDKFFPLLHAYEETGLTPEDIEHTMQNFSSFLMEMTGGRMSKTNYTVQAMVAEANDYQQQELDEIEKELEQVKAERDALKVENLNLTAMVEQLENSYQQLQEINDRTFQSNQAMGEDLKVMKAERDAAIDAICKIAERGTTWMCPYCKNAKSIYGGVCACALGIGVCRSPFTKFEWRGEKLEDSYYG